MNDRLRERRIRHDIGSVWFDEHHLCLIGQDYVTPQLPFTPVLGMVGNRNCELCVLTEL